MREFDVCIVGGGAAGLAAAASLKEELRVCILEKNEIPGRKLAATGGGRCNLTNEACSGKSATLDFFASLGIETYCDEEGRYYPYTNKAQDVVKALVDAQGPKASLICGTKVTGIGAEQKGFVINTDGEIFTAKRLILATGGKAAPQYGTTGDGYGLARSLGHRITRVYPILAPIQCLPQEWEKMEDAAGVRAKASVRLFKDGVPVDEAAVERGELQFTEDGLSGICIFNLTPYIRADEGESVSDAMKRYTVSVDLAPDFTEEELQTRRSCFGILTSKLAGIADREMKARSAGVEFIKDWRFTVSNVKGWRYAQCTAGGVKACEVDPDTMESKTVEGLYLVGELMDIQGVCGGFNLQNAWETALKAAKDINDKVNR